MNKLISIYWFVILMLVAGGIFAMVSIFYNAPYDVREIEADLLAEKIADCIYFGGEANSNLYFGVFKEEFRDNFLKRCSLNFDTKEYTEKEFYAEVSFYSEEDLKNPAFQLSEGNFNWKADCSLDGEKYEKIVKCSNKKFYALIEDKNYLVDILTIVRKTEENVR